MAAVFETTFPVRYYETDQMGIVHHSNYIRYFECARNTMMETIGYPIQECEKDGITFPVVSVECHYKHPAKMGDVLTIRAVIEKAPLAKLTVQQSVVNQDGLVCAEGTVVLGMLGREGHPVRCPEKLYRLIESKLNQ